MQGIYSHCKSVLNDGGKAEDIFCKTKYMYAHFTNEMCVSYHIILNLCNAPVILSRFGRYVVPTLLTPTFRRNWCWYRLGATLCHDVLRCCHAIATPEPRYCPALTRLTSVTVKFSCVVLRYVSLPPRCSLAVATLSCAVPRIWRNIACHNVSET